MGAGGDECGVVVAVGSGRRREKEGGVWGGGVRLLLLDC